MKNVGIDIGSTTVKVVVMEGEKILYRIYQRHLSQVRQATLKALEGAKQFLNDTFQVAISGSAGLGLAEDAGVDFVQEVFATYKTVMEYEPDTDAVIELGGEDAKIIFLSGGLEERMNGSCAGGTGAFIDQMATLLNVTTEELDELSLKHERIYPIASRCGVFAKTDIQPLLNQGAHKEDVAASIFQAVVDQTVTGLSQGRRIEGKVLFLGGPLFFFKGLQQRFQETLKLGEGKAVFPSWAQYSVAIGAAIYARGLEKSYTYEEFTGKLENRQLPLQIHPLLKAALCKPAGARRIHRAPQQGHRAVEGPGRIQRRRLSRHRLRLHHHQAGADERQLRDALPLLQLQPGQPGAGSARAALKAL